MKPTIPAVFGILLAVNMVNVNAAPYIYTFRGTIDTIEIDGQYYSDVDFDNNYATTNDTFRVGDSVEYKLIVDFDLAGFCNSPIGTSYSDTCTGAALLDTNVTNYFFASLYSASKQAPPTEENTTFNYGINSAYTAWIVVDSAIFVVSPYNEKVENWVAKTATMPGTQLTGTDAWAGPNASPPYGRINSTLELVSIEPYVTTPVCKEHKKEHKHHWHKKSRDEHKHSASHESDSSSETDDCDMDNNEHKHHRHDR